MGNPISKARDFTTNAVRARGPLIFATLAFGSFVYALLPGWTIALNDDFAYLRSVVETIQHGRPWTNDFLEPWAMSLSVMSAFVFGLTGSFSVATIGLQVLAAMITFFIIGAYVRTATSSWIAAIGVAAAIATFPTILWKQIEYTAMVVYLPCLLGAVWSVSRSRWVLFCVFWTLAASSRQSAVAWLALPCVIAIITTVRTRGLKAAFAPVAAIMFCGGLLLVFSSYANVTHAQRYITSNIFKTIQLVPTATALLISIWITAIGLGCFAAVKYLTSLHSPGNRGYSLFRRYLGVVVGLALLASLPRVASGLPLSFEHPLFENEWAANYLCFLMVLSALGWIWSPPKVALEHAITAAGCLGLSSLRSEIWDYYLIDGVLIAALGIFAHSEPNLDAQPLSKRVPRASALFVILATVVILQIMASAPLKRLLDNRAGACAVLEKAMRDHWMDPTELTDAPFGFCGWHWFPYYIEHGGKDSGDLGGFGRYIGQQLVDVRIDPVSRDDARRNRIKADDEHPYSEVLPRGWFGYARFYLQRRSGGKMPEQTIIKTEYHYEPFPLNDAEWRAFIGETGKTASQK